MKKLNIYIPVLLAVLCLASCGDGQNTQQVQAATSQQQAAPYPVTTIPQKTVTAYTDFPASIEGIVNSEVRAKVSGYITDVLVDEGEKVSKGEALFKLETQSLSQDAEAAQANVNAAQVEVDKLKPLVEKGIIGQVQLETAKAKLAQAKANYNSISANIAYATIKSPVDGYVGSVRLRKGSLVSPSDQTPLTVVSDISEVYAYFSMNEKDYLDFIQNVEGKTLEEKIKNLPEVQLLLANGNLYEEKGKIETINSQVNKNTGSISFRATFKNPARILTNGNSGKVQIPTIYTDALVVPKAATFEQQGITYVYKVAEDMAISNKIEIKGQVENLYIIKSGLSKNDPIVVKGIGKLRNETPIKPQEMAFDSVVKPLKTVFR